ncbi:hypothetical protein Tco_0976483 [Tanacetum coccineum]|uniref:Uncharacterized protein n=1 Tax=Tanacetum coccineum TaxID=301880 RepID=A0ABQ5EHC3_9ASTR
MVDSSKGDAMADVILDDLFQKEFNEQEHVKDDKGKLTRIECVDNLENRIQNVEKVLYKLRSHTINLDTSTKTHPSTHPFQTSSDDTHPSTHPFQTSSDDTHLSTKTLETNSDDIWERKNAVTKVTSKSTSSSKTEMCKWYLSTSSDEDSTTNEDSSSDDYMTVFKGKTGSSSNLSKAKTRSSSKHLTTSARSKKVYVGASAWSKTLLIPTKRPPLIRSCILGLVAVSTYAKILNKEFGIRKTKDDVAASVDVARKGKRKMV